MPIYGLKEGLKNPFILENGVFIGNLDILAEEYKIFEEYGLKANYNAVLGLFINMVPVMQVNPPGISAKVINKD